jgi:hypothetical protein
MCWWLTYLYIYILHFGVVEHSAELLMGDFPCGCLSTLAPLHSAHVWMRRCLRVVPHAFGESTLMCMYKYGGIVYLDVYQAALTRRWTPKHACLQIVLYIVVVYIVVLYLQLVLWFPRVVRCLHILDHFTRLVEHLLVFFV